MILYSTAKVRLSQRSISEFSFHGSSHWSPIAGQIDSARVSEAPLDSDFDTSNLAGPNWKLRSDNYNTLADIAGSLPDFSPLPLDGPSAYHFRLNNVSTDSQDSLSSLQFHKPAPSRSRSNRAERKQPSRVSLVTPAGSEASERLPWMQGEDLQIGLPLLFSEPEGIPNKLSLDGYPSLW